MLQVDEDEPLFMSLIADLFPGIQLDSASYDELQVAIGNQVEEAGLVNHPSWNLKVIQVFVLYDYIVTSHATSFTKLQGASGATELFQCGIETML